MMQAVGHLKTHRSFRKAVVSVVVITIVAGVDAYFLTMIALSIVNDSARAVSGAGSEVSYVPRGLVHPLALAMIPPVAASSARHAWRRRFRRAWAESLPRPLVHGDV